MSKLLSIAIPSYNRPNELSYALTRFAEQIEGKYEHLVEIIVTDDKSTDNTAEVARQIADRHSFIKVRVNPENIGLERNLINCTKPCSGKYLWIFGDDDFLELDDSLSQIMAHLERGEYEFFILNRTRRNKDLSKLVSDNWMRIPEDQNVEFDGLRAFCGKKGLISVIGFITVNIFRREKFAAISPDEYMGTMYPQLGMMVEAFADAPTLLLGKPLVCHRTETMDEKRAALGNKETEKDFMSNVKRRDAKYFSLPFIHLMKRLVDLGCLTKEEIVTIPENTVINGYLVDFLINTAHLAHEEEIEFDPERWDEAKIFFDSLPLTWGQKNRVRKLWRKRKGNKTMSSTSLTFSAITPSYNQGEFLADCLTSVQEQTIKPVEHFVFDPGSADNSRQIARGFKGVTLVAEKDEGQSDAINKGFQRVKGDIIAWLNSDDYYFDDRVFERVAKRFEQADKPDIVYGKGIFVKEDGSPLRDVYINKKPDTLSWRLQQEDGILQPALFMRREVVEKIGLLTPHRHYCMDYEYWIRCMKEGLKFVYMDENLALASFHTSNKTYGDRDKSYLDVCDMLKEQFGYVNHIWLRRFAEYLAEGFDGVVAHAHNQEVTSPEALEEHYQRLLKAYNAGAETMTLLQSKASEKGYGDTLREMKRLEIGQSTPCKTIPLDRDYEPGHVSYTVGPKRWAFDAVWKKAQIEKSHAFLRKKIAERRNDTCIIVGNGPSLNKINLDLLEGQDVIISNNVFLSPEVMKHATYYTVVNYLVAEQSAQHINRVEGLEKILPYWTAYCLNEGENTHFIDAVGYAEFSKDLFKNASWRHTVSFYNLHIAYGLGYRKVVMIGFDHSYRQQKGIKEGEVIQSNDSDQNHFNGEYFRGKKWQAADVDMMEEMYRLAKAAFEEDGREIVNATVGGALELFKRQSLEEALDLAAPAEKKKVVPFTKPPAPEVTSPAFTFYDRQVKANVDETHLVYELLKHRGKEGTMVDVGAHHGWSAAPFAKDGWRIACFEPDPNNRKILTDRHGDKANITIDKRAVGEKSETGRVFYSSEESTGISGMLAFRETHKQVASVDVTTVGEIVDTHKFGHIDFLKIDVEGFDFSVLKGVPWDRIKPEVIECEFEDEKTRHLGHNWRDICEYLVERGYTVYVSEWHPIVRYGVRHDWFGLKQYPCELGDSEAWGNLLAFRDDPGAHSINLALDKVLKVEKPARKAKTPKKAGLNGVDKQQQQQTVPVLVVPEEAKSEPAQPIKPPEKVASPQSSESMQKKTDHPIRNAPVNADLTRYARFALGLKAKNPTLFRFGQFAMSGLRAIKRRPLGAFLAIAVLVGLIVSPLLVPELAPFKYWLWAFVVLLLSILVSMLAIRFGYAKALKFAEREHLARQGMKAELLREIRQQVKESAGKQNFGDDIAHIRAELERGKRDLEISSGTIQKLSQTGDLYQRELGAKLHTLQEQTSESRNAFDNWKTGHTVELTTRLQNIEVDLKERLQNIQAELSEQRQSLEADLTTNQQNAENAFGALSERLDTSLAVIDELQRQIETLQKGSQEEMARHQALTSQMDALRTDAAGLTSKMLETSEQLSDEIDKKTTKTDEYIFRLTNSAPVFNFGEFQTFGRKLTNAHVATLTDEWSRKLSFPVSRSSLFYLAHRICSLESSLHGRLATSIEDAVLRTLVASSVKNNQLRVLEIGTLFGVGLAMIYNHARHRFEDIHLTAIDPLEGYYSKNTRDIVTDEAIDEQNLRHNLALSGITESDFTLIKGMSTDDESIEATRAGGEYDVLIIDGDHSYAGVKADFLQYLPFIARGGYIIFDDYNAPDWPGVTEFVDEGVRTHPDVAFVGASWRTAIFRVVQKSVDASKGKEKHARRKDKRVRHKKKGTPTVQDSKASKKSEGGSE